MTMLVVGCNNTLNNKLSESEQECFQTKNSSLNIGDDTTILQLISTTLKCCGCISKSQRIQEKDSKYFHHQSGK